MNPRRCSIDSGYVSPNGKAGLVVLHTGFEITDVDRGKEADRGARRHADERDGPLPGRGADRLHGRRHHVGGRARRGHQGDGAVGGRSRRCWSALILRIYFRSVVQLVLLTVNIAIATTAAFGVATLTVGHLNAATAFLGAIIAGNGINYGIFLIARYLRSAAPRLEPVDAMTDAISGTVRPTAVASLGVAIAYGSLAVDQLQGLRRLRGHRRGRACCCAGWRRSRCSRRWCCCSGATPTCPRPARWSAWSLARRVRVPAAGRRCARPRRLVTLVARRHRVAVRSPPIRSSTTSATCAPRAGTRSSRAHWMQVSDDNFGRGISGKTFIAADDAAQVPKIVTALRAIDNGTAEASRTIGTVSSILDVVPIDQPRAARQALAQIRKLLDDDALEALDDKERAELAALRPPDDVKPITVDELPQEIKDKLVEKDGRLGLHDRDPAGAEARRVGRPRSPPVRERRAQAAPVRRARPSRRRDRA